MLLILLFLFCFSCIHILVIGFRFFLALKSVESLNLNIYDKLGMYFATAYFFAYLFL